MYVSQIAPTLGVEREREKPPLTLDGCIGTLAENTTGLVLARNNYDVGLIGVGHDCCCGHVGDRVVEVVETIKESV
mgnify:CR=1 FL=1